MGFTRAILAVVLTAVLIGTLFVSLATANGNNSSSYILKPEARDEIIAFVNEAKDFVLVEGKDKAFKVFNDPKGKFVRGDLYMMAYDFNGTRIVHPYLHELIGQNGINDTDLNGAAINRNARDLAKRGGGFTYYIWPNPAHSNALELKLTYVLEVDEGSWLGAGVYLPGQTPIFNKTTRDDLVAFVKKARDFALNHTKEEAMKAFNDKNGEFIKGDLYIFAGDFEGNTLALPFQPEQIGSNHLEAQDPNGVYMIQEFIDVAKRGEGFAYAVYPDPEENMIPKLKLEYVMKVNDEWFVGSGIYWPKAQILEIV